MTKSKVSFDETIDTYGTLQKGEEQSTLTVDDLEGRLEFPPWDILKELDRRSRRTQKESNTRRYMREHPEVVEEIKKRRLNSG